MSNHQIPRGVPSTEVVEPTLPERPRRGAAVKQIILWSNGMVTVFDENGEQMLAYQGRRNQVIAKLRELDLSQTEFYIGSWGIGAPPYTLPCTREQFFSEGWK